MIKEPLDIPPAESVDDPVAVVTEVDQATKSITLSTPRWSKKQTVRTVRDILGPWARVWDRDGVVKIGLDVPGKGPMYLGQGRDYEHAFRETFIEPLKRRERVAEETAKIKDRDEAEALAKLQAPSANTAQSSECSSDTKPDSQVQGSNP